MRGGLKSRSQTLSDLSAQASLDVLVIGAGATGVSTALLAAQSGCQVALLEARDFGSGTSSRSSKLLHGGVRYLAQGRIGLVRQALRERSHFVQWAPHLAQPLSFVLPATSVWERSLHRLGLGLYQGLAGSHSLGATSTVDADELQRRWPELKSKHWAGGVAYWDALFEDARMALWLASDAQAHGAHVLNHAEVTALHALGSGGFEVAWRDTLSGTTHGLRARCVINACGVWVDHVRQLRPPTQQASRVHRDTITPSQGIHLVLRWPQGVPEHRHALLWPHTADGRVLFFIPWLGHWLVGTTDTWVPEVSEEPRALAHEIEFLCQEASKVLQTPIDQSQVCSVWAGLRPLAVDPRRAQAGAGGRVSREHAVQVDYDGLINVLGGKWTTCRVMAQDALQVAQRVTGLRWQAPELIAHPDGGSASASPVSLTQPPGLHLYGPLQDQVRATQGADVDLGLGLSEAMVRHAVRHEQACTVQDVLARRHRMLFLDARLAQEVAPQVSEIMTQEGVSNPQLSAFLQTCQQYQI